MRPRVVTALPLPGRFRARTGSSVSTSRPARSFTRSRDRNAPHCPTKNADGSRIVAGAQSGAETAAPPAILLGASRLTPGCLVMSV